ncbi:MAG TPA: RlmE family RNA methyltransferase [Candidatus Paceibacterota bacterium]
MVYIPQDKFAKRARREGFRARSAYKLLDLQKKFQLIKAGDRVLDLGAAPGGWIQVASPIVGQNGLVVAVDIEAIDSLRLRFKQIFQKNIEDEDFVEFLEKHGYKTFDVVLSDVAPNTTGMKERDQALAHELCLRVLEIAIQLLDKKGNMVMKIFEGPDTPELIKEVEKLFSSVKLVKPMASTKGSKELYLVARNYKN